MDILIFITVGTQDKQFNRLFSEVHKCISQKKISDNVVAQIGCSDYKYDDIMFFDKCSHDELEKYVKECDILITHGGVGSLIQGINNNKKIIAVPRLSRYKEAVNDHQVQIVNEFYNRGYILKVDNISELSRVLEKVKTFKPKKFRSNKNNFVKKMIEYIEEC